jgi:hypothetical protein
MEPHRKGDLTEAVVLGELKRRNVPVSFPFGDNERYDAIAETPSGSLVRLQIKTGRLRDGTVRFDGTSSHTNAHRTVRKSYDDDTDVFLVYCHELDELYSVPETEVTTRMQLRVDEPDKDDPKINPAEQYRFDRRWPFGSDTVTSDEPVGAEATDAVSTTETVIERFRNLRIPCYRPVDTVNSHDFLVKTADSTVFEITAKRAELVDGRVRVSPSDGPDTEQSVGRLYAIYCPDTDEVYLLSPVDATATVNLWVDTPERVDGATRFAEAYELAEVWPPTTGRPLSNRSARGAAADAFERNGSTVGRIANDDCTYDLLVATGTETFRVSVVPRWLSRGCLRLDPPSCEGIDWFVIYYRGNDTCYLVAATAFDRSISLRVEPPEKPDSSISWAREYELDDNWPPAGEES